MQVASLKEFKEELKHLDKSALSELVLQFIRFKKDNKELLQYLLFEQHRERDYILDIKEEIEEAFKNINTSSYFLMKKTIRKQLRLLKKYLRYSKKKNTEVELILHFCKELSLLEPSIQNSKVLMSIFHREIVRIEKIIDSLHEDLQYDYLREIEELKAKSE
ncbi:MAG: hypothetical protein H6579_05500 [Chitinophagales bacterium]|nr:hypothetical protein [Chitinophagales bacterium]